MSLHLVAGVCEGLAHGELVVLILLVEAECEAEDVGVAVGGAPVVEHVRGRHPLPPRPGHTKGYIELRPRGEIKNNMASTKIWFYVIGENFLFPAISNRWWVTWVSCVVCKHY